MKTDWDARWKALRDAAHRKAFGEVGHSAGLAVNYNRLIREAERQVLREMKEEMGRRGRRLRRTNGRGRGMTRFWTRRGLWSRWFRCDGRSSGFEAYAWISSPGMAMTSLMTYVEYKAPVKTYLMYKPEGAASEWVPLWFWSWDFEGSASRTLLTDPFVVATPDKSDFISGPTDTHVHPIWNGRWAS